MFINEPNQRQRFRRTAGTGFYHSVFLQRKLLVKCRCCAWKIGGLFLLWNQFPWQKTERAGGRGLWKLSHKLEVYIGTWSFLPDDSPDWCSSTVYMWLIFNSISFIFPDRLIKELHVPTPALNTSIGLWVSACDGDQMKSFNPYWQYRSWSHTRSMPSAVVILWLWSCRVVTPWMGADVVYWEKEFPAIILREARQQTSATWHLSMSQVMHRVASRTSCRHWP